LNPTNGGTIVKSQGIGTITNDDTAAGANIIGTELDDNLTGTAADDTISGLGGRDHLYGGAGNDTLLGGAGDDAMHGDAGADIMLGGAGNDDYYVDDVNDVVSETTQPGVDDGGTDRVYSTVSYTLSPFLERLVLLESAVAISATGNAQVNAIVGNSNANILSGGGGKDTLTGGVGADTFVLGPANAANTVTITDFAAEDKFGITATDYGLSQGSGLVDNGSGALVLDPTWFATVTGTQGTVAGHGQFLYNTNTRSVMWDPDGSGAVAGIALATLQTGAVVNPGNFAISGTSGSPVAGDISITDVTIAEGNSGTKTATFTVSHTGTAAFSVNYATADGSATAGSDYVATSNTLNFAAGSGAAQSQTVSVTINGDTTVEPDETFFVNLLNPTNGGTIVKSQGIGTITNDDTAAGVGNISITDVTIAEGNAGTSFATFTVTRTGGNAAFDLTYATADGTATAGTDYVAQPTSTVSFAAGDLTKTISVAINGDTTIEPDETFFVNLSNATNGGTIVDAQGLGTITNDDSAAGVGNISINDVTITEGNSGTKAATFTVSHTGTAAFSVNYATANSTATAGITGDYLAASGTLNFADGTSTQTVSVTINGDTIYEPNETFFVNLMGATNGGTITKSAGLGTLANDDTAPVGPAVVAVHDMSAIASGIGSWDPSGLAYDPATGTLYLVDSEVDEVTPRGTADMWALNLDGTLKPNGATSLYSYTTEPTGIAFDPASGNLYITDDDVFKVNVTNVADPSVKLASFATAPLGGDDPEDVSFNPVNGHLYIANGSDIAHPKIIEVDSSGTQVIRNIPLPAIIKDPEAVVYDVAHDVFFVGIENGHDIWMVDHNGNILNDINIFANYRNPVNDGSVSLKGLTLAPSSDPNDDSSVLSLYAADFGISHVNDGRLFEISNPFFWNHQAPVLLTNNFTTVQNQDGSNTILGVQVSDSNPLASSEPFALTAATGAAAPGTSVTPSTSSGSLTAINGVLATGETYHPGLTPPSSDNVTLTVKDNFGATDTVTFVFAQPGSGPTITLQGTAGKDVILATNSQDVLTGGAAQDQFVFAPTSSGTSVQHTITDFTVGLDNIDVRQFSNISASALPTETQEGSDTLITLDSNDTLLLKNIAAINLHASDFIVHA
jgi:hypothetical protein